MARTLSAISDELQRWIEAQKMFFVATAPLTESGHINCSPKGGDTLRVLNPHQIAYLDLTGSGSETIAHLHENGRIVVMLAALDGPPRIVRLHGRGEPVYPSQPAFAELRPHFPELPGLRTIIRINVTRISESCGMAVPEFDFVAPRTALDAWAAKKGPDALAAYRKQHNARSIDALPGLREY